MSNINTKIVYTNGFNALKHCRHGMLVYCKNDMYVGRSIDLYGEFSFSETELFQQIIQPGMIALDVGANLGAHTLFLAQQVGEQGRVIAFEPQRIIHQQLCANMAINSITNTHCLLAAAGNAAGTIKVPILDFNETFNFGGVSVEQIDQGETVSVVTIDSLKLANCHFIKIDVEGMEHTVIDGATKTINQFRPVLYVENDRKEKSAELIQQLLDLNYKLYWHLPPLFNPNNYFQNKENVFDNIVSVNMLCLPQELDVPVKALREVTGPDDIALKK